MTPVELNAQALMLAKGDPDVANKIQPVLERVIGCHKPLAECAACRNALDDVEQLVDTLWRRP
jgi:hypothetical protein